jgi:hypothetical protein
MTVSAQQSGAGHVFISYVHEDRASVDKLQEILDSAGIPVWRDTEDLWPGEDWRLKIRRAITNESLTFIACFSKNSNARELTYQNEELVLAIEQLRKRPPGGTPWLIPIRLDDCVIPEYEIGAGRLLDSLQAVDLFGENRELAASRLIASIMRILATAAPGMPVTAKVGSSSEIATQVKEILLDPARRIELHDLVTTIANDCRKTLVDQTRFPLNYSGDTKSVIFHAANQTAEYWQAIKPLAEILATGCAWSEPRHEQLWTTVARSIANTVKPTGGLSILLNLRRFPTVALLYVVGIASIYSENYGALRAVAIDAKVRTEHKGDLPLVGVSHVWRPFENNELLSNILAYRASDPNADKWSDDDLLDDLSAHRLGNRYTPVSDYLHDLLRDTFQFLLPNDDDYTEIFDRLEVFLAALAIDVRHLYKKTDVFTDGPWFGSFTWRGSSSRTPIEAQMKADLYEVGANWPPIQAGLFGGSVDRALVAVDTLVAEAGERRRRIL